MCTSRCSHDDAVQALTIADTVLPRVACEHAQSVGELISFATRCVRKDGSELNPLWQRFHSRIVWVPCLPGNSGLQVTQPEIQSHVIQRQGAGVLAIGSEQVAVITAGTDGEKLDIRMWVVDAGEVTFSMQRESVSSVLFELSESCIAIAEKIEAVNPVRQQTADTGVDISCTLENVPGMDVRSAAAFHRAIAIDHVVSLAQRHRGQGAEFAAQEPQLHALSVVCGRVYAAILTEYATGAAIA